MFKSNPNRPSYVTKKKAKEFQPFVDKMIRRYISSGVSQEEAVDRALDLRDSHIKLHHSYKNGKVVK